MISAAQKEISEGEPQFRLSDVTELLTHLSRIMIREIDCLKEMKVAEVENLQKEKIKIGASIEMYRRQMEKDPSIKASFTKQEIEDYIKIKEIYEEVAYENERRLTIAREVNGQIVEAIKKALREADKGNSYNSSGDTPVDTETSISLKLNEMV